MMSTAKCLFVSCVFVYITLFFQNALSARIVVIPVFGNEHNVGLGVIAEILERRGHSVTMLLPSTDTLIHHSQIPTAPYRIRNITVPTSRASGYDSYTNRLIDKLFSTVTSADVCDKMFSNYDEWGDPRSEQQFDLAIVDSSAHCGMLFTEYFKVPYVSFATTNAEETQWHAPLPLAYVPLFASGFTDKMTFTQRVRNVVNYWVGNIIREFIKFAPYHEIQRKHNISTELSVQDIQSKARLWLWAADFSLEFPRPLMPHVIPIGAFSAEKVKPLSKDLDNWIEGSQEHGIVVISMGSQDMDTSITRIIADAISRLSQRVVWKYNGHRPDNLGQNTKIMQWIPQNDLLAHPKTRLFVTHGGSTGVYEGVYHAVPMVCLPQEGHHFDSAAKIVDRGIGQAMRLQTMTSQSLFNIMDNVIMDKSYKRRAQKLSAISHDKLMTAEESVVYWINYVLKHGTDHLISQVPNLTWYQYYLLDIAAFYWLLSW
ncbi:2-hydroxyacylsphingosine 1-beta-galactosyltransferase-like [Saccoglossus kowalevskii]